MHAGAELYGADKVLLELVEGINTKYNPIVILPVNGPLIEQFKEKGIETLVVEYPILRRKIFNLKGIINYIKDYIIFSKKLRVIASEKRIDLIHVNTTAVFEGIAIKKMMNIPLVWHVHEIIVSPKIISRIIAWAVCKFSDVIVVVSEAVKQYLLASNIKKKSLVETIYNGVPFYNEQEISTFDRKKNDLRKRLGIKNSSVVIGMIGRINSWKGQSDFLKSVEYTLSNLADSHAVIIGGVFEGEEWRIKKLSDEINKSANSSRIHLLDFQKDILQYHNMFDIFVLPSTNPDPLPTVVLEAMSLGKTVLGYNHGGVIEMVHCPQKVLVEPGNIQKLSDLIFEFASDSSLREKLGNSNLLKQQTIFNVNNYHKKFIELYDRILGE
ncbi:glycosyltransferase family 4 protein [Enterococcus gilvus]|uniref:glycosyltransferase family 4 protein n=1 Tax=Enterococcus gilvus TaxID=160453 RepID=UPI003D6AC443